MAKFVTLVLAGTLAAQSAVAQPVSEPTPEVRVPTSQGRATVSTGSTQPFATSTRPSIGFLSAASLADRCQSSAAGLVSYCFAYITGVHDTVRAYETWLRVREFCPPITSSQGDMRRAFLTYLKANPDVGSGEAASVIVLALKDQFACVDPEKASAAPAAKR